MSGVMEKWFRGQARHTIEPAEGGDMPALSEIHGESFARGWSDGELESLLAQEAYACLVARPTGKKRRLPEGFIVVKSVTDDAEIITIAVGRASRRKGIARALMDAVIRRLQSDRLRYLYLEVDQNNTGAVALYGKLGFEVVGHREGYYASGGEPGSAPSAALVMRLDLG